MLKIVAALLLFSVSFADVHSNPVPSRLQWMNNSGYCGEVCLISAGLYYGQYLSQYDVRALVTPTGDQVSGQLLIGVNDVLAAQQLHLTYEEWDTSAEENTEQFLVWIKEKVVNGNPVAIGVYANQTLFQTGSIGDPEYDHIVSITSITSNYPLNYPSYFPTDQVGLTDDGLWRPEKTPGYYFNYGVDRFQRSRISANEFTAPPYSTSNDGSNYGIAILGVADLDGDTLPVRVETDYNYEYPPIGPGSDMRPSSMPLTLTITVSNIEPNIPYILYRYDDLISVPESQFNVHEAQASEKIPFQIDAGTTYVLTEMIQSNEVAVYRCVRASAP